MCNLCCHSGPGIVNSWDEEATPYVNTLTPSAIISAEVIDI